MEWCTFILENQPSGTDNYTVRSVEMKWREFRGKCQLCGRVRYKKKSVLRYKEFINGSAIMACTFCGSEWVTKTFDDAQRQVAV